MLRKLPSQEELLMLLAYDHETGALTWRKRGITLFQDAGHTAAHTCHRWNARMAGKEAFTAVKGDGYKHGAIHGVHYCSHRVIWKMVTGEDPMDVDHIDGDRQNNRWSNLRNVPRKLNLQNRAKGSDNRSGVIGVRQTRYGWQATISDDGKVICVGSSKDFAEAVRMRREAEIKYGYHPNHGRTKREAAQ